MDSRPDNFQQLDRFARFPGVLEILLLGRDGLIIGGEAASGSVAEFLAASVPAIWSSADRLGAGTERGDASRIVIELEQGVLICQVVSTDLAIAVLLERGVAFASLLVELRTSINTLQI